MPLPNTLPSRQRISIDGPWVKPSGAKEKPPQLALRGLKEKPGDDLLSQGIGPQVPSAQEGLTAEFGMGSGVSPPPKSPEDSYAACFLIRPLDDLARDA